MKRFFLIAGSLIFVVIAILVTLGYTKKEVTFSNTLFVTAPVEDSWATFMDVDRWADWMPGIERVEILNDKHFRLYSSDGTVFEDKVTAIDEHVRYTADVQSWRQDNPPMASGSINVTFEVLEDGTRIVQTTTLTAHDFVMRCIFPLISPFMQNNQMHTMDALGYVIENDPSEASPPVEIRL